MNRPVLSLQEQAVVKHFQENHTRDSSGRFIVPLPVQDGVPLLGELKSLAVRRFKSLERSLTVKSQFDSFAMAVREYFEMGHAKPVPASEPSQGAHGHLLLSHACSLEGVESNYQDEGCV